MLVIEYCFDCAGLPLGVEIIKRLISHRGTLQNFIGRGGGLQSIHVGSMDQFTRRDSLQGS